MSELNKENWAVVSERGVEASELSYDAALNLRRTLEKDKINGLCVVTNAAARREAHLITLRTKSPLKG